MKFIQYLIFDLFIIFCVHTILTGAYYLPSSLIEVFGTHAKSYKTLITIISAIFLAVLFLAQVFGGISRHSFIISRISQLNPKDGFWLWFAFLFLSFVFAYSSWMRHYVFQTNFDFAIFSQAIWNTWHGNLLYSSIKGGINLLGDHVSPILIFLAPLYGLWDDPAVLLIFQAVVAASSVSPIYYIAKKVLAERRLPLIFVLAFCFYQPLRNAVRFEFHPELLGDPLLLWAFYFILCNRLKVASIFLFFLLLTKEVACGPLFMLALYTWWFQKKTVFGITWAVIAITVLIVDIKIVAPTISGWEYAYLGGNYLKWKEVGLATFLANIFQVSTVTYLKNIFMPLGFLSILSPSTLLLTFPILIQNLLTPGPLTRSIFFQYTAFLTPFVFVSAIYGFRNCLQWAQKMTKGWFLENSRFVLVFWVLSMSLFFIGNSEFRIIMNHKQMNNSHFAYLRQFLRNFPPESTLRTHMFLAPHAARRKELHLYENKHPREGASIKAQNAEFVAIDQNFMDHPIEIDLKELKARGYEIEHEKDGFYLLKKKSGEIH